MEALIVAIAALAVLVLIDAGYWIAISLMRWSPVVAIGALASWLALQNGVQGLEALGIGFAASVVTRHYLWTRSIDDSL